MPADQEHGIPWRVKHLEREMKTVKDVQADHSTKIQARITNEEHVVMAIHDVKQEIRSFKNYALGTMVTLIVGLLVALFRLIQVSNDMPIDGF